MIVIIILVLNHFLKESFLRKKIIRQPFNNQGIICVLIHHVFRTNALEEKVI
jgi:hypothetical protein